MWYQLVDEHLMDEYESQILTLRSEYVEQSKRPQCTTGFCNCNTTIRDGFTAENEGYPTVIVASPIAHVVAELNVLTPNMYTCSVFPVVMKQKDRRRDKKTDYYIIRIKNRQIRVVIEIKTNVPTTLSGDHTTKKNLAQLFLELFYAKKTNSSGDDILGIITDSDQWHFFLVEVRRTPFLIKKYISLSKPQQNSLCSYIRYFIDIITNKLL